MLTFVQALMNISAGFGLILTRSWGCVLAFFSFAVQAYTVHAVGNKTSSGLKWTSEDTKPLVSIIKIIIIGLTCVLMQTKSQRATHVKNRVKN